MHCEDDKTYNKQAIVLFVEWIWWKTKSNYNNSSNVRVQCTQKFKDEAGSCPICGMDLVPLEADISEEDKTYKKTIKKVLGSCNFYCANIS